MCFIRSGFYVRRGLFFAVKRPLIGAIDTRAQRPCDFEVNRNYNGTYARIVIVISKKQNQI